MLIDGHVCTHFHRMSGTVEAEENEIHTAALSRAPLTYFEHLTVHRVTAAANSPQLYVPFESVNPWVRVSASHSWAPYTEWLIVHTCTCVYTHWQDAHAISQKIKEGMMGNMGGKKSSAVSAGVQSEHILSPCEGRIKFTTCSIFKKKIPRVSRGWKKTELRQRLKMCCGSFVTRWPPEWVTQCYKSLLKSRAGTEVAVPRAPGGEAGGLQEAGCWPDA